MTTASDIYISLGSNINPEENLYSAIQALQSRLDNCQYSRVYCSPAVGMQGADFLNAVVSGSTSESMYTVVSWLLETEKAHGRVRTENKFTDRTLDLDLLLYGNCVYEPTDELAITLPHPDIIDQAYVLQPLADIAGHLIHPVCNCSIDALLARLKTDYPDKFAALQAVTFKI